MVRSSTGPRRISTSTSMRSEARPIPHGAKNPSASGAHTAATMAARSQLCVATTGSNRAMLMVFRNVSCGGSSKQAMSQSVFWRSWRRRIGCRWPGIWISSRDSQFRLAIVADPVPIRGSLRTRSFSANFGGLLISSFAQPAQHTSPRLVSRSTRSACAASSSSTSTMTPMSFSM